MSDISGGPETWISRADALADVAFRLFAGESAATQRYALARLLAVWLSQFPPTTLADVLKDPDIETRDQAMIRLLGELHRAEARLAREKWLRTAQ